MDDDAPELRERIDKLEQIAAKQQETIDDQQETIDELESQSLLGQWGRRGVLGSIAAALGIASASGSAAAGVGDVGTPSERVDAYLDQADVNALEAGAFAGDITDYNNVTSSRSIGTVEENTDSTNRLISVDFLSDGTETISVGLRVGNTSNDLTKVDAVRMQSGDISGNTQFSLQAEVAPGMFYLVRQNNPNEIGIRDWSEANRA